MRFGFTKFGAITASLVTAAGVALCSAEALSAATKTQIVSGYAEAKATAKGDSLRRAVGHAEKLVCAATASGAGSTEFRTPTGLALAVAQAVGHQKVNYLCSGEVEIVSTIRQAGVRIARAHAAKAQAFATLEGQGQTYEIGYAGPARASAWAFGTTYLTGKGQLEATSKAQGTPSWIAGARSNAQASAAAQAKMCYIAGAGGEGVATASGWADSAVTRDGERYFEIEGHAQAGARAIVTNVGIYQSQTGYGYARIEATPVHTRGGSGHGQAMAIATGDAESHDTAATSVPGYVFASATGWAHISVLAAGEGIVKATLKATPLVINTRAYGAVAQGKATTNATPKIINTKANPETAYAIVQASGLMSRILTVRGNPANAKCIVTNSALVRTIRGVGVVAARAVLACMPQRIRKEGGRMKAMAAAEAMPTIGVLGKPALASAEAYGHVQREHRAAGTALAIADAEGWNQVNDLLRAPPERTAVVGASPRLVEIDEENRRLAA